jgi:hypothetical protein
MEFFPGANRVTSALRSIAHRTGALHDRNVTI